MFQLKIVGLYSYLPEPFRREEQGCLDLIEFYRTRTTYCTSVTSRRINPKKFKIEFKK